MTYLELYLKRIKYLTGGKEDYESLAIALLEPINSTAPQKSFLDYLRTSREQELANLNQALLSYSGSLNPLEKFLMGEPLSEPIISTQTLLAKILALKIVQLNWADYAKLILHYPAQEILEALVIQADIQPQLSHPLKLKKLLEFSEEMGPLEEIMPKNRALKRVLALYHRNKNFFDDSCYQAFLPFELLQSYYEEVTLEDLLLPSYSLPSKVLLLSRLFQAKIKIAIPFKKDLFAFWYIKDSQILNYLLDSSHQNYPEPYSLNIATIYPDKPSFYEALNRLFEIITPFEPLDKIVNIIDRLNLQELFAYPWQGDGPLLDPIFYLLNHHDKAESWLALKPQSLVALHNSHFAISSLIYAGFPSVKFLIKNYYKENFEAKFPANHPWVEPPFAFLSWERYDLLEAWIKADSKAYSLLLTRKIHLDGKTLSFYEFAIKYCNNSTLFCNITYSQLQKAPSDLPYFLYDLLLEGDKLSHNFEYLLQALVSFYQGKPLPSKLFGKLLNDYLVLASADREEAYFFAKTLVQLLESSRIESLEDLDLKRLLVLGDVEMFFAIRKSFSNYSSAILSEDEDFSELLMHLLPLAFQALCKVNYEGCERRFVDLTHFLHDWVNQLIGGGLMTIKTSSNKLSYDNIYYYITCDVTFLEKNANLDRKLEVKLHDLFFDNKREKLPSKFIIYYYHNLLLTITSFINHHKRDIYFIKTSVTLLLLHLQHYPSDHHQNLLIHLMQAPEIQSEVEFALSPLWQRIKTLPFKMIDTILNRITLSGNLKKAIVTRALIASVLRNDNDAVKLWLQKYYLEDRQFAIYGLEHAIITLNLPLISLILNCRPQLLRDKKDFYCHKLSLYKNFFILLKLHLAQGKNQELVSDIAEKLLDNNYPIDFIEEASNLGLKDFAFLIQKDHFFKIIRSSILNFCNFNYSLFNLLDIINFYERSKTFCEDRIFITISKKYYNLQLAKCNLFLFQDRHQIMTNNAAALTITHPLKVDLIKAILINPTVMTGLYSVIIGCDLSSLALLSQAVVGLTSALNTTVSLVASASPLLPLIVAGLSLKEYLLSAKNLTYDDMQKISKPQIRRKWQEISIQDFNENQYLEFLFQLYSSLNWNNLQTLIEKFNLLSPSLLLKTLFKSEQSELVLEALVELIHIINLIIIENNYQKAKKFITNNLSQEEKNTIYAIIMGKISQFEVVNNQTTLDCDVVIELQQTQVFTTIDYDLTKEPLYLYLLDGGKTHNLKEIATQDKVVQLILELIAYKDKIKSHENLFICH